MKSLVEQIADTKMRNNLGHHVFYEIQRLETLWDQMNDEYKYYFSEYIPVKLVTLMEVACRSAVKTLINSSKYSKEQATKYMLKIPSRDLIQILTQIDERAFSMGELVAHIININKLEDIFSILNAIYEGDFKTTFECATENWIEDVDEVKPPWIENAHATYQAVDNVFRIRHIIVHESPLQRVFELDSVKPMIMEVLKFTSALSWSVTTKLFGPIPKTQSRMNNMAWEAAECTSSQISKLVRKNVLVSECLEEHTPEFLWVRFAHAQADLYSGLSLGRSISGSIAPTIFWGEVKRLNNWRIQDMLLHSSPLYA